MKGSLDRTKVVLRHLPPSITRDMLMDQIDNVYAGRYNWVAFRPGKSSQNKPIHSRAYINFNRPEDVIDFAEFFDGHVFVNEKGTQYKTIVEYAPSQHVPKQRSKKDGREGTIQKDPEYMEFLEHLAKPVEHLPSAEIQLERKEAERSGAAKDAPIITPLMDYVRQKRASKVAGRRSTSSGKLSRRAGKLADGSPSSMSSKRSYEKRRGSTTMYILRDSSRSSNSKDRSGYALVSKRDESHQSDRSTPLSASRVESMNDSENVGSPATVDSGKKKIILLKGKERDIASVSVSMSQVKNVVGSPIVRQNRHEGSGRMIRSILINKDTRQGQSSPQAENQAHATYSEKEKRPPRPSNPQAVSRDTNGLLEDSAAGIELPSFGRDKQERRTRNKDRPERGAWASLRRSDELHASDETLSAKSQVDSTEGNGEVRILGNRRSSHSSLDNGFHKAVSRREYSQGGKDLDGSLVGSEKKPSKRGGPSAYGSHEKQVWVQKSNSGT